MALYTLFQDAEDLHTIVRGGRGWPGAVWSTSLFAVDCWRISQGIKTELDQPTRAWVGRMWLPEAVAFWYSRTGGLLVRDSSPGDFASRYLGLTYDEARWADLEPAAFAVAVRAAAACNLTMETAARALLTATPEQLAGLSHADVQVPQPHDVPEQNSSTAAPQVLPSAPTISTSKKRPARR